MQQIRARVATGAGLEPPPWVLEARVAERMSKLALRDLEQYREELNSRAELACLVELLRVGETSFFRHQSQLRALEDIVIPDLPRQGATLRIWSAGCATGEEPYTLAMLLGRVLPATRKFSILASDISEECLQRARAGIYSASAWETVPAAHRSAFDRLDEQRVQVHARFRKTVTFEERNLSLGSYPGEFDLIFCRNVLIYFSPEARRAALKRLVLSLRPGGYLFLGYSESLRDIAGLEPVQADGSTAYRRCADDVPSRPRSARKSTGPSPARVAPLVTPTAALASLSTLSRDAPHRGPSRLQLQGQYPDAIRLSKELRRALEEPGVRSLLVDLDGADFLGEEAASVLKRMQATARAMRIELVWSANRAGHLRFLRRHELVPRDEGET